MVPHEQRILSIIPARSGSKGVPGKNVRTLNEKPLLTYSIDCWKESGIGGRLVLSTDNEKIAQVAKAESAEVPFLRPPELAGDSTPMWEVVLHALNSLQPAHFDCVVLLQPTVPFRKPAEIRKCVDLFFSKDADTVVTIAPTPDTFNPHWLFSLDHEERLSPCMKNEELITRRQDLPRYYHRTGSVYVFRPEVVYSLRTVVGPRTFGVVVENPRHVNIDTMSDWRKAERIVEETPAENL